MVRSGLDALKEEVGEGTELAEAIRLTDAFMVLGEFEVEASPFSLTLTVEGEFVGDAQGTEEDES